MQNQQQNQQNQQQQWFNKQQQQQPQQPIILQRQIQGIGNYQGGPTSYMARPRQPQMGGMNQNNFQGIFNADQQQQGMKPNQPQQSPGNSVLSSQLQGGIQHQVVMGPPNLGGQHTTMQQQMMQNVRSPPPIASPQANPSPRPAPSPRAQPSPHHLPSHSPGGDMHNHLVHPHQSPLPAMDNNVMGESQLNAQEQLSKFVEKL